MLAIRSTQIAVFAEHFRNVFEANVCQKILLWKIDRWPSADDATLPDVVRRATERALHHGFTWQSAIENYVGFAWKFGIEFECLAEIEAILLTSLTEPNYRITLLNLVLSEIGRP